jgi:hypothetical protein
MGKTVLLKALVPEVEATGWATVFVELYRHAYSEATLTSLVSESVSHKVEALSVMASVRNRLSGAAAAVARTVTVSTNDSPFSFGMDPSFLRRAADVRRSLGELIAESTHAGCRGCVLIIDEAQYLADDDDLDEYPMSLLLATVAQLQLGELPLALILCGLPSLDQNIGRARPQAERLFRGLPLEPLTAQASADAFRGPLLGQPIDATPALVDQVVVDVQGYPHFVQLWGAELWAAANARGIKEMTPALLAEIRPQINQRIEVDVFDFRMRQLDLAERDLLLAARNCTYPPLRPSSLAKALGVDEVDVRETLNDLARDGIVDDPAARAEYVYTVPRFDVYLATRGDRWGPMEQDLRPVPGRKRKS